MMNTKGDNNLNPYSVTGEPSCDLGVRRKRGTFVDLLATSLLLVSTLVYVLAFMSCECRLLPCLLVPVLWPTYGFSLKLVDRLFSGERRTSLAFWLFYCLWHLFLLIDGKGSQPSPSPFFKECMDFHCRFGCSKLAPSDCICVADDDGKISHNVSSHLKPARDSNITGAIHPFVPRLEQQFVFR